jgi:hypothetical protein
VLGALDAGRAPVSDRATLGGVTQLAFTQLSLDRKLLILNGEMAEWSMAHAWKAIWAKRIEQHRNAPTRNRFNDFPLRNVR